MKQFQTGQANNHRQILKGTNRIEQVNWEELCYQLEEQKNFFKQQYQKLYQSYCQKKQKIKEYKQYKPYIKQLEERIRLLQRKNQDSKDQNKKSRRKQQTEQNSEQDIQRLKRQNEILTEKLIKKNQQLQEVYIQLQQEIAKTRGGFSVKGVQSQVPLDFIRGRIATAIDKNFEQLKQQANISVSGLLSQPIQHPPPVHRIISMPPFAQIPIQLQHINSQIQMPIVQHAQHFEFLPPVQHIQTSQPIFSGQIPIVQPFPQQIKNVIRVGQVVGPNVFSESNNPVPSAAIQFCPITPVQP